MNILQAHYGKELTFCKFLNFPLVSPSQIALKFYSLVEQFIAKILPGMEADSI